MEGRWRHNRLANWKELSLGQPKQQNIEKSRHLINQSDGIVSLNEWEREI